MVGDDILLRKVELVEGKMFEQLRDPFQTGALRQLVVSYPQ